jgi:hypothetical protein
LAVSFTPIRPLLQTGVNSLSRWLSYIGLGIGVLLLLCSVQMFINIRQILKEPSVRQGEFDFISITKTVTNQTMGEPGKNIFTQAEIDELKASPYIDDVGALVANQFRVELSAAGVLPFQTSLFLESIEDKFIDTLPPSFTWQEGQTTIPVIVSSDFLEIFNVFGPSYDLPQVSPETASDIPVLITCYGVGKEQTFQGKIVAFSDRINSVLVPKSFLDWANQTFMGSGATTSSRVYLKTKDANNPGLLNFLDQKNYKINKDKTKFGRVKQVMQGLFSGLGIFGLLVVLLALMLFSFYLQLVIARSKDSLQLLLTLGYSPRWLSSGISRRFIPVYILIVLIALACTQVLHWAFHHFVMYDRAELKPVVHWSVGIMAFLLIVLSVFANHTLVRRLLRQMSDANVANVKM